MEPFPFQILKFGGTKNEGFGVAAYLSKSSQILSPPPLKKFKWGQLNSLIPFPLLASIQKHCEVDNYLDNNLSRLALAVMKKAFQLRRTKLTAVLLRAHSKRR